MYELSDLFLIFGLCLGLWYWLSARTMKEMALQAVRRHCQQMNLELLDESVVLKGYWLKRDPLGQMRLWRSYVFDFSSTGDDRYQGRIIFLGKHVEAVHIPPHRLH